MKGGLPMKDKPTLQDLIYALLDAGSDPLTRSPEEWELYLWTQRN